MVNRNTRPMQWYTSTQGFSTIADGATTSLLLYNAATLGTRNIKGATMTRLIIDLTIRADSVAQLAVVFWGIVVMNADAAAAAAFPDPEDMSDRAGWMVRGKSQTIQASLSDASQWDRRRMDIRSQRVLRTEEDELRLIVHNSSGSGVVAQWGPFIRVLARLP